MHKIDIPAYASERMISRRGRVTIHDRIDPRRTAHLVVDLQNGFVGAGQPCEIRLAREIVPNVNAISAACRANGGLNVFLRHTVDPARQDWTTWFDFSNADRRRSIAEAFRDGGFSHQVWPGLVVTEGDVRMNKYRYSPFTTGASDLHRLLQSRGIDTVIVTGTLTNVCCESTARDAMMLNYKVVFVSDGCATHTDDEHNATLGNMLTVFADVRTSEDVVGLLDRRSD